MTEPSVRIDSVFKTFSGLGWKVDALSDVRASLASGQITALAGPDGAGKTTLIRMIAGLLQPDAGHVSVLGKDSLRETESIHETMGYMPQRFGLYEDLTVQENLNLFADLRGVPLSDRPETFARLLDFAGMAPFGKRLAGHLSGGMKQKLGLACTLIKVPKILLLDEPSVGVDPVSRRELWNMVEQLAAQDITVLWSTAYLDEVERCPAVILLNEGKVVYEGAPSAFTEGLKGRSFKLSGVSLKDRRFVQAALRQQPAVLDAIVQGTSLRVVSVPKGQAQVHVPEGSRLVPVAPRFEDAFVAALTQDRHGASEPEPDHLARHVSHHEKDDVGVLVQAKALTRKFGDFTAVDHVDFEVRRGEIFGLLGPNGAGKSTTFRMMCGLLPPTSGLALTAGFDLAKAAAKARGRLGYMSQKFSLYGNLSVMQNLRFFSGVYGLSFKERRKTIGQMLDVFGLAPFAGQNAEDLPLGYKQRLSLACAIMHKPDILFLDEPTSGVDPLTRREFWRHIGTMADAGVSVLVTTHFMDEAEYCDRLGIVYRGQIIATGAPDDIKGRFRTRKNPDPTLEDAFISLIEEHDVKREET